MRVEHQIRAFEQLLNSYDGQSPLHRHLVNYFKQNKQMGSSDRRWATRYIYSYFRMGKALANVAQLERLAIGDFLCHQMPSLIVSSILPQFANDLNLAVADKLDLIKGNYPSFELNDVFPFQNELSEGIDRDQFLESFFTQPDLYIRVKSTHISAIANLFTAAGIAVREVNDECLALPNGTKLEQYITDPRLYQVQDLSSQETGRYFLPQKYDYWWDCCAASGGKSLLLHSLEPQIELLVSDVRANSLGNLAERFQLAGIKKYHAKTLDLLQNNDQVLHDYAFDGILVDAPCSGAGTWGRTPEMLYYFQDAKVNNYVKLQKVIASNAAKYLKAGKPLIYMTCSVFKAENEDVVNYLVENCNLQLEKMELIKGYQRKADSMFVARLIKR